MTTHEVIFMLEELKHYIEQAPVEWCLNCLGNSRVIISNEEFDACIKAGLRSLDLVIEKVKEKM